MERPTLAICLLSTALCISGGFQQGYIASVLNPPYVFIKSFVNETVTERVRVVMSDRLLSTTWSFLNVIFPIASIVGQLLAAFICKRFGRKRTAIIGCLMYLPGTIMSSLSYPVRSFEMLFIGRFLWSLGNGINVVNSTVWIIECAPIKIRGAMGAMQELSIAIGSLACQTLGLQFSDENLWPWMFAPVVPLAILSIGLFMMVPDSPVSILEREGDIDKALSVLAKYHGCSPNCPEIDKALVQDKAKTEERAKAEDRPGVAWIFNPFGQKDARVRVIQQAAWLGVIVKIAYEFTGARTLRAFSTFFLIEKSHFIMKEAIFGSWIIAILRIPFTLVPVLFVDRLGRKLLMNVSMVVTVVALIAIIVGLLVGDTLQMLSAIAYATVMLVNAAGLASVSRFYAAELLPRSMLIGSTSILISIESITKIVVEFAWYPLATEIGVWSMLMFLLPSLVFLVVIWATCPETSNRTATQVLDDIAMRKNLKVTFAD